MDKGPNNVAIAGSRDEVDHISTPSQQVDSRIIRGPDAGIGPSWFYAAISQSEQVPASGDSETISPQCATDEAACHNVIIGVNYDTVKRCGRDLLRGRKADLKSVQCVSSAAIQSESHRTRSVAEQNEIF